MAYEIPLFDLSGMSSGDMSSNQYKLVAFSSANATDGVVLAPTTAGGRVDGVYQDNSTATTVGKVRVLGVSKVQVSTGSGPIVRGSLLSGSTAAHGTVTLSTSTGLTQAVVGVALQAITSGSSGIIPVLLRIGGHLA